MSMNTQKGFTLVELSIVLVIIGLIISSVLVGQDLIRSAELRATVTQYEQFNAAVATFRGKYGGLPGDVTGNASYGFVGDGDGDGALAAATNHDAGENVYFWNHLGSTGASLISGSYLGTQVPTAGITTHTPSNKSGESWGVFGANGTNYFVIGATTPDTNGEYDTIDILTPLDAKSLDDKIDDGRPNRGVAQAKNGANDDANATVDGAGGAAGNQCASVTTAVATYVTSITIPTCTMRFKFNL